MIICQDIEQINIEGESVVAIGKFDGTHLGHRKIFSEMKKIKESSGLKMALFSFINTNPENMSTVFESRLFYESIGTDYLFEISLFDGVSKISAEDFVSKYLVGKMHMKALVAGEDLTFGHNRDGDVELMLALSKKYDFEVYIIDKVKMDSGIAISSSMIHELLCKGDVKTAASLIGDYYTVSGVVEKGNRIGSSSLHFPTINIYPDDRKLMPKSGVYATYVRFDGNRYKGMTNIGINPTIDNDFLKHKKRIETHILDFSGDLYGKDVKVDFVQFIRDEKKFDSIDELRKQIEQDRQAVRTILQ